MTRLAVTVTIPQEANINYGDQAGVLFYSSDAEWVKLVVEGDKTRGSRMIVLAHMPSNTDAVSQGEEPEAWVDKKWVLGTECPQSVRLQLELRRGVACCTVIASYNGNDPVELRVPFDCARLGVMAHLCREQAPAPREGWFHFSDFSGGKEAAAAERGSR